MTSTMRSIVRLVLWLVAAGVILTALYVWIPADWSHAGSATITLRIGFVIWAAIGVLVLLRLRRLFRSTEGGDSSFTVSALRNGVFRTIWDVYRRQSFPRFRLWLLYAFWGILIICIVVALSAGNRLDDAEGFLLLKLAPESAFDSTLSSRLLLLETGDNNPTDHLHDLARIAYDLRKCGVHEMVAYVPPTIVCTPMHKALVDSINRTGIAILYSGYGQPGRLAVPFYTGQDEVTFSRRTWFVEPVLAELQRRTGIVRWTPADSVPTPPAVDALTEAAARHLGSTDTLRATLTPHTLIYGTMTVPLDARGRAAVFIPEARLRQTLLSMHAVRQLDSDTLIYYSGREWRSSRSFPQEFAHEIRGSTVFVVWIVPPIPIQMNWNEGTYIRIVEALLRNETVREFEYVHLVTTCLTVLLSAVLCLKLRPGIASCVVLLGGVALLGSSTVLLATHQILLQAAYPAVAAMLSGGIFPLVRLAHENA